jgi:hypothetical protein
MKMFSFKNSKNYLIARMLCSVFIVATTCIPPYASSLANSEEQSPPYVISTSSPNKNSKGLLETTPSDWYSNHAITIDGKIHFKDGKNRKFFSKTSYLHPTEKRTHPVKQGLVNTYDIDLEKSINKETTLGLVRDVGLLTLEFTSAHSELAKSISVDILTTAKSFISPLSKTEQNGQQNKFIFSSSGDASNIVSTIDFSDTDYKQRSYRYLLGRLLGITLDNNWQRVVSPDNNVQIQKKLVLNEQNITHLEIFVSKNQRLNEVNIAIDEDSWFRKNRKIINLPVVSVRSSPDTKFDIIKTVLPPDAKNFIQKNKLKISEIFLHFRPLSTTKAPMPRIDAINIIRTATDGFYSLQQDVLSIGGGRYKAIVDLGILSKFASYSSQLMIKDMKIKIPTSNEAEAKDFELHSVKALHGVVNKNIPAFITLHEELLSQLTDEPSAIILQPMHINEPITIVPKIHFYANFRRENSESSIENIELHDDNNDGLLTLLGDKLEHCQFFKFKTGAISYSEANTLFLNFPQKTFQDVVAIKTSIYSQGKKIKVMEQKPSNKINLHDIGQSFDEILIEFRLKPNSKCVKLNEVLIYDVVETSLQKSLQIPTIFNFGTERGAVRTVEEMLSRLPIFEFDGETKFYGEFLNITDIDILRGWDEFSWKITRRSPVNAKVKQNQIFNDTMQDKYISNVKLGHNNRMNDLTEEENKERISDISIKQNFSYGLLVIYFILAYVTFIALKGRSGFAIAKVDVLAAFGNTFHALTRKIRPILNKFLINNWLKKINYLDWVNTAKARKHILWLLIGSCSVLIFLQYYENYQPSTQSENYFLTVFGFLIALLVPSVLHKYLWNSTELSIQKSKNVELLVMASLLGCSSFFNSIDAKNNTLSSFLGTLLFAFLTIVLARNLYISAKTD